MEKRWNWMLDGQCCTVAGKAIRESNIPRSESFLVTKLSSEDHGRPLEAFKL
ncbi:hypothetical protein BT96DRAFT_912051, partial [Gymnopus androsaceus JB14]